ncbi:InlB B-repeat-containing protein [Butyrivibrio sp. VCB2006]|uniref:InlB B-repeat-containing protein n=1 Tax=Butyrivibrio sp. VCB2006 TaxID=1280679 RepID=UPI000405D805|nr:InlB B-repeat-containing protein [Butyrivibrio sp. VCB2006]
MRMYKKLVSLLLVGTLALGNGQITAKAVDYSTDFAADELSLEPTDISNEDTSASTGLSDGLIIDSNDIIIFPDDEADESEDSASLSSTEPDADIDDGFLEVTDDTEKDLFKNTDNLEEDRIKNADDLEDISTDDLPEELPEDFYTEYPTGGVIDLEPLVDIESYSNGRKGLLQADYLDSYYVTPDLPRLRKQSPYATCWAFAAVALAEINLMKSGIMPDADLSELHLAYFMYNTETDPLGGTAGDYSKIGARNILNYGGRTEWGFNAWERWMGVADEATVPYSLGSKANSTGLDSSLAYSSVAHIVNYYTEPIQRDTGLITTGKHANLKRMIRDFGAISIDFYAYSSMSDSYSDKIYNVKTNAYYNPSTDTKTNHSVVLVGWDDDFPKTNFAQEAPGDGAFLVRNSWRSGDGSSDDYSYSGYFWMSYYEASLGSRAYAAEFTTADNYDNNYQYDAGLLYSSMKLTKAANIFKTHAEGGENGESLEAVNFYTSSSNVSYTIDIYTDLKDLNNPESGTHVTSATTRGTTTYSGQYTIELADSVTMPANTTFSVVVSLKKSGETVPYGLEFSYTYGTVTLSEGQSFYYSNGKWGDLTDYGNVGNFSIKAYTNNVTTDWEQEPKEPEEPKVELEDLNISSNLSGNATVGNTYKFTAAMVPSNYEPEGDIKWSTTTPTRVSVNESTGEVKVLRPGPCSVTATLDGVSKSVTFDAYPASTDYGYTVYSDNIVKLWWNGSSDATSYRIYKGTNTSSYTTVSANNGDNQYTYSDATFKNNYNTAKTTYGIGYVIAGKVYKVSLDVTLRKTANITYVLNGGTNNPANPSFYVLGTTTSLYTPTHSKGYVFEGWYLDAAFSANKKRISILQSDTTDLTFYAKFSKTDISGFAVEGFVSSFDYDGQEHLQNTHIIWDSANTNLVEGEDYETYYGADLINAGTKTVSHVGKGGFTGTISKTYTINAYDIQKDSKLKEPLITVTLYDENGAVKAPDENGNYVYIYDDEDVKPSVGLTYANAATSKTLVKDKDYTVSYKNNTAPNKGENPQKMPTITITGKGNFTGSVDIVFYIDVLIYDAFLSAEDIVFENKAGNYVTTYVVTDKDGKKLESGVDYDKAVVYTYATDCVLLDGTARKAGETALLTDIVPAGTRMKITATWLNRYSKEITGEYTILPPAVEIKNISVIYNGNGATSGTMAKQTLNANATITLTANKFVRKYYEYAGWNTEADGKGTAYDDKAELINDGSLGTEDITLYAQWKPIEYKITYHTNGGQNNPANPATYTIETDTFSIAAPDKANWAPGYQFAGWYKDSGYTTKITEVAKGSYGDLELYAKWIPYTYTVRFDGNGATSGSMVDEVFSYGVSKALTANAYSKKGAVFQGWAVSQEDADALKVTYQNKQTVKNITTPRNDVDTTVTLYAVWKSEFAINYDLASGRFAENTNVPYSYTYGTAVTLPTPVRDYYVFNGWYKDSTYKTQVKSISRTNTGDVNLVAKWTPYTFNISFNSNGATSGRMSAQKFTYGTAASLRTNAFVKNGYKFAGWNAVKNPVNDQGEADYGNNFADGGSVTFDEGYFAEVLAGYGQIKNNATITLYAQWKETKYAVSFDTNGGSVDPELVAELGFTKTNFEGDEGGANTYYYEYNHKGGYKLPTPTRKYYSFMGWYSDNNYRTKVNSISQSSCSDITLYARWNLTFTVYYEGNNPGVTNFSGTMKPQNIGYDAGANLTKNAFKCPGYTFMGWAVIDEDDGQNTTDKYVDTIEVMYTNGQKIIRPEKLVYPKDGSEEKPYIRLYAVWRNRFSIRYSSNTESLIKSGPAIRTASIIEQQIGDVEYDAESLPITELPVLEMDGYTFGGWYLDPNFKTKVTSFPKNTTGDKDLYAKWTGNKYTITYKNDSPTTNVKATSTSQSYIYGTEKAIANSSFKIPGFEFVGWSTLPLEDRGEAGPEYMAGDKVDHVNVAGMESGYKESVTLYAVWEKISYGITYENVEDIDNSANPDAYTIDDTVTLAEPQAIGDTFLGWYSDKNFRTRVKEIKKGTTGNKTFYAKWAKSQYTIRYDLNEDAGTELHAVLDTSRVGYVDSYNNAMDSGYALATATREGYSFGGWYKDKQCRTKVGTLKANTAVDMTVYAKWIPNTYRIHLISNAENVTGTMKDMTGLKVGTNYKLTGLSFKKQYYSFTGWNTESDGTGISFNNAQTVKNLTTTDGETVDLYAQWAINVYNISYHLNGGVNNPGNTKLSYTPEDETFDIMAPDQDQWPVGYYFGGWYSDNGYKKKVEQIKQFSTTNYDLYAKWVPYKYTVHFDGNGATSGSMPDEVFSFGVQKALNANKFAKKGAIFQGWAVAYDGYAMEKNARELEDEVGNVAVDYKDKYLVTTDLVERRNDSDGEITLKAVWRDTFYITYLEKDPTGSNADSFKECDFDGTIEDKKSYKYTNAVKLPTPVKTGYTFGGWYKDTNYKTKVNSITASNYGDFVLYAKWTPYTYTVKYNGNGATSGSMAATKYSYGIDGSLRANTFVRKGYSFEGWNIVKTPVDEEGAQDYTGNIDDKCEVSFTQGYFADLLQNDGGVRNNVTYTLYAQWKPRKYNIDFKTNGGQLEVYDDTESSEVELVDTKLGTNELIVRNEITNDGESLVAHYEFNHKGGYKLPTPTKEGYSFVGWYSDPSYRTKVTSIAQSAASDMTLYARWDMSFVVRFHGNGMKGQEVSGTMKDQTIKYDSGANLTKNAFKNQGYAFMGWTIASSIELSEEKLTDMELSDKTLSDKTLSDKTLSDKTLTDKVLSDDFVYKNAAKIQRPNEALLTKDKETGKFYLDLYAVWKDRFTISYVSNIPKAEVKGAIREITPNSIEDDDNDPYVHIDDTIYEITALPMASLPTPERDGYNFGGWYSDAALKTRVTNIPKGSTGDKTLYAKWNSKTYTVTFNADAPSGHKASGKMNNQNLSYGVSKALSGNAYKVTGYAFVGWSTLSYDDRGDAEAEFTNSMKVAKITDEYQAKVTLYAVWKKVTYNITYQNVAGIDGRYNPTSGSYTVDDGVVLYEPYQVGYTFLGWYSDKNYKTRVKEIKKGSTGNKTFYGKWSRNE